MDRFPLHAPGGPFSGTTVDSFNGTSSYMSLPSLLSNNGNESISLWFKTTTPGGVLFSSSSVPITSGTANGDYAAEFYIGTGGDLNAEFWNGSADPMLSTAPVDDGKWHNAVLAASGNSEVLYVDGVQQATLTGTITLGSGQDYDYVGAGFLGGTWPHESHYEQNGNTGYATYYTGNVAEVAYYPSQLAAAQVTDLWNASKYSGGLTPVQTDTVTDPGGHTLSYVYDAVNGDRVLSQTDGRGQTTTYGYDVDGFQDEEVNPDGDVTQTGYDVRGNMVSQTTCQNQAAQQCSTSYYTYYPDDTSAAPVANACNDVPLTYRDPRSSSATDTTYETTYTCDATSTDASYGEITQQMTPPVPGFPNGRPTTYLYTDGTTAAGGYPAGGTTVPPRGLPYKVTTAGGAVTTTLYYADGDVAEVKDADGLQTTYTYDGVGRVTGKTVYSDSYPNGLTTTYTYTTESQVATETDPPVRNAVTGAVHTAQTTTSYDPDGDVTAQTVADSVAGGDASRTVKRTYNANDLLATSTDAAGATTSYTYNAYGDLASETDPGGNTTDDVYDADGNLLTVTLQNYTGAQSGCQSGTTLTESSRSYDPAGRLASITDSMCRVTSYGYTDNGLLATVTRSDGSGNSFTEDADTYDAAGNLVKQVTNNGATTTDYTVDAASRVTSQVLDPSGLDRTTTISYTPDDRPASITKSGADGTTQATSYTYDPMGNQTSASVTQAGAGGPVAWYPLTQTSGTSVTDSASGGQPATATGVTWSGSGASFAGTSGQQIATGGPALDTTNSFTVAAWVNMAGNTSTQTVAAQAAGTDSAFYLKYDAGIGEWAFTRPLTDTTNPSWPVGSHATTAASTGTWTFLTGTFNANTGTMQLYVNGSSSGATTGSDTTPFASHGPLLIGRSKFNGNATDFFDGQIADVQVYPRALSASDVSTLYGLGKGGSDVTTGKLTTSWTLDQRGLPTSVTDPDGNATDYTYDEAGRLAVTTGPAVATEINGSAPLAAHPQYLTGYDTFGETAETENPDGNVTTYGYDADGRQTTQTLPQYTPPSSPSGSAAPITATSVKTATRSVRSVRRPTCCRTPLPTPTTSWATLPRQPRRTTALPATPMTPPGTSCR